MERTVPVAAPGGSFANASAMMVPKLASAASVMRWSASGDASGAPDGLSAPALLSPCCLPADVTPGGVAAESGGSDLMLTLPSLSRIR